MSGGGLAAVEESVNAARRARELARQLHPYVAVDVVVFTIDEAGLKALLVRVKEGPYAGSWAFPGGLVEMDESLEEAAIRQLTEKTGVGDIYLEQLRTFGDPGRDPHRRVVSTAYFALVARKDVVAASAKYAGVAWLAVDALPALAYDHNEIARYALERLRAKLEYTNIVYSLLPREFTLAELQGIYEAILGRKLDRRNFRKKLLATNLLRPLARRRTGAHRPAMLYAFTRRRPVVIEML